MLQRCCNAVLRKKSSLRIVSCNITVKVSHRSREVTAEKCTKKRDARAKLLFCLSKPFAFLPFSLPSPSSLLKLSSYVQQKSLSDVVEENT